MPGKIENGLVHMSSRKLETELVSISCPELRRAGLFAEGKSKLLRWSNGTCVLVRGSTDRMQFDKTSVYLAYTPANLGGRRPWLICPQCHTQRARLFLDEGEWQCRICAEVRYETPRINPARRPRAMIARIDQQLTWARRPWQARILLAKRARQEAKLKAMK